MIRKIVENVFTAIVAIIGVIGGTMWAVKTGWDYEPTILVSVSAIELVSFIISRSIGSSSKQIEEPQTKDTQSGNKNTNEQKVNVNVSLVPHNQSLASTDIKRSITEIGLPREEIIEIMKKRVQILFIDDDKNFRVVQNLKDGGWKLTKSVEDIKNVDVPTAKKSHIFFVDINGVGNMLNLEHEGLDLALMLKKRYPDKKVIIYSANKNSNSFHEAWNVCDFRLEKNALPYQFQSLVESYSIELYRTAI
jgi:hypothetical protein